jgi:hypothetical protein
MASEKWFDKAHHGVMRGLCVVLVFGLCGLVKAEKITDFEDLTLANQSYWKGADGSGGFASGSANFNNSFTDWGGGVTSWEGFAYSNMTDTASWGMDGQYNAIAGCGQGGSENYAVGYMYLEPLRMVLDEPTIVSGLYVTNNNYAYYSMLNGDMAKKFDSGDWFLLEITGKDASGNVTETVPFYLADFRDGKNIIVNEWQYVDLTLLGMVKSVEFSLSSTDNSPEYGMYTPAYFVIDTVVPEPGTLALLVVAAVIGMRRRTPR